MVRKIGQIIRRGPKTWLVRIYVGRDRETRRRKYVGKFVHGGLRSAQAHLNCMLSERDLGRNICSSRQTVGQYLDHWLDICARPRLPMASRNLNSSMSPMRGDVKEKFLPFSPRGDGCCGLHPAPSQFWLWARRVFRTDQAVGGLNLTVS